MTDVVVRDSPVIAAAADAAAAAAHAAGVEVRTLNEVADLAEVRRLLESIWRTAVADPPVTADLLKAMVKAGSYVSGAYDGGTLVGACCGFFSAPARWTLHSHITGVLPGTTGRHVGLALKLHQRAWALARGAVDITWTYDPLVRRNAHFNLAKLAARPLEYLPDFYGAIDDAVNRDDPTDRLLVRWPLAAPEVAAACVGRPAGPGDVAGAEVALDEAADGGPLLRFAGTPTVLVRVPADIEALRLRDPGCAAEWRTAVREVLGRLMDEGGQVRGFDRRGWYVVDRREGGCV